MSPNSHAKKNHPEEWCAFESIVRHGIINCFLTHMPSQFTQNLFLLVEPHHKNLKNVSVNMTMFIFIVELGFPMMAIIVGYKAQSTPFPWNIEPSTQLAQFVAFQFFCNCDIFPLSCLLSCNLLEVTQVEMLVFKFNLSSIQEPDRNED